jgi:hypothetical protein
MNQLIEFFKNLFETSDWPPRWVCGNWSEFHGWLYIVSDMGIWLAYFIIPLIIIWFVQKRPTGHFLSVFWLFGAFILLCGTTHMIDVAMFWWPAYRVNAIIRFLTAVVSFATVFALIRDLPEALNLRTADEGTHQKRRRAKEEDKVIALRKEIASLINLTTKQEHTIASLRSELTSLKEHQ